MTSICTVSPIWSLLLKPGTLDVLFGTSSHNSKLSLKIAFFELKLGDGASYPFLSPIALVSGVENNILMR